MRELTESGWSASEASRAVLAGEVATTSPLPQMLVPFSQETMRARRTDVVDRFLKAGAAMGIAATGAILDEIFAQGSYESIVDDLLMPALASLGDAWTEGDLDVAAEHVASAAVHRRLSALYEAAAVIGDASVVVGLPPGARHELGALAFAVAVRRLGVGVLFLGADVPVASWVHVMRQDRVRVAVIAIVQEADQDKGLAVAQALRISGSSPTLTVGGPSARFEGTAEAGIVVLPDRISEAAVVVARLASGMVATTYTREQRT